MYSCVVCHSLCYTKVKLISFTPLAVWVEVTQKLHVLLEPTAQIQEPHKFRIVCHAELQRSPPMELLPAQLVLLGTVVQGMSRLHAIVESTQKLVLELALLALVEKYVLLQRMHPR